MPDPLGVSSSSPSLRPGSAPPSLPVSLSEVAHENLRWIRSTVERAGVFTAVSGPGTLILGGLGAITAAATHFELLPWLEAWLATGVLGLTVGVGAAMAKARRIGQPLTGGVARRFALGLFPPLAAGGVLTVVAIAHDLAALLPGSWLLLYGVAIVTSGALSPRLIATIGLSFMLLGGVAFAAPPSWHDALLAAGFGGLHIVLGLEIERRHRG